MDEGFARLTAIGFELAGNWKLDENGIVCELNALATARNVLYAFVIDGDLKYVGKTVQSLRARMAGYQNPAPTQSTNIKNHRKIQDSLSQGKQVALYVLPDNGLLHYGGFHVNLAAGLEDSVVRDLNPPWNGREKEPPNVYMAPQAK